MIIPILRALECLLTLVALGLVGYTIHISNQVYGDSHDTINFNLFVGLWSLVSLVYLVFARLFTPRYYNKFAVLGFEIGAVIFWTAGWISLAALIGTTSCQAAYEDITRACQTSKTAIAIGAFSMAVWMVSLSYVVRGVRAGTEGY